MPTAGRCPTAAASIISPRRDRLSPETVVRFLASCARHRVRRGRRPGAVCARHGRDAPRLADRLDAGRQPAGERRAGAHRDAVRARHMGLRRYRPQARHPGPQLDGMGRDRRFPAGARDRAARTGVAGGGLRPVPPVRHRQAAADPLFRAPLSRRLRRHVRRHPRRSLHADGAGTDQAAVLLMRQLAARIGKRLKASRATLVTAESCTGGWVAQAVTAVAGSSDWFERGFVTYSNDSKRELLGVRAGTLARHGAGSEETAREMASGALRQSKASLSVAVTGIAGPRSEEHTSELQSQSNLVCRLLLEKKKKTEKYTTPEIN